MLKFVWHFEIKNVLQKFQVMGTCLPTCLEVFEILLPEFEHWPVGQKHKAVSGIMYRSRLKSYLVILCVHFSDCIFFFFFFLLVIRVNVLVMLLVVRLQFVWNVNKNETKNQGWTWLTTKIVPVSHARVPFDKRPSPNVLPILRVLFSQVTL